MYPPRYTSPVPHIAFLAITPPLVMMIMLMSMLLLHGAPTSCSCNAPPRHPPPLEPRRGVHPMTKQWTYIAMSHGAGDAELMRQLDWCARHKCPPVLSFCLSSVTMYVIWFYIL